jgi:hypothetical protein
MTSFKTFLPIFSCVLLLVSCLYRPEKIRKEYHEMDELVNCLRITPDFYMDRFEITLFNWREYMYWTGRVFGTDSPEYAACKPDVGSLNELYGIYDFEQHYVADMPGYPMVGVSQQQAEAFSKWRSDRVFEFVLISKKILDWNPETDPENYFTIERYFKGEYQHKMPRADVLYYPVFSLPSQVQFELAFHYTDSVSCTDPGECWWDCFPGLRKTYPRSHRDLSGWTSEYATRPVDFGVSRKTKKMLFHLTGNVAEWSAEPGITMGGGWNDQRDSILSTGLFRVDSANAWTGFRNVLTWKKWDRVERAKILEGRINEY